MDAVDPTESIYRNPTVESLNELLAKIPPPPTLVLPGWFTPEQRAQVEELTRDGGWGGVVYSDYVGNYAVIARVPCLPDNLPGWMGA